ncbi:hypothetical protein Tco_0515261 [Tanacetum coccineum]
MPRKSSEDYKNTRHYIPKISHEFRTPIREKLMNLEERYIHEGRVVFDNFADLNYVRSLFHFVEFNCLLEINEQICPRFILEFYSQFQLNYSDEGQMFVEFVIQNQLFSYSLETFAQILDVPCQGACVFTDRWRLDELAYGIPSDGPYQTNLPPIEDIISSIRIDREGQVRRIRHEEEIDVLEYQILTREIVQTLKPLEEIIRENVFCLGVIGIMFPHVFVLCFIVPYTPKDSILPFTWQNEWSGSLRKLGRHKDHVSSCLCHLLYCIETSTPYNLAFFILKRMEKTRNKPKELLPYGMLLARLFKHVVSVSLELAFDRYLSHDQAMHPLAPHYKRKTRADRGKKRPRETNASSSSTLKIHLPHLS